MMLKVVALVSVLLGSVSAQNDFQGGDGVVWSYGPAWNPAEKYSALDDAKEHVWPCSVLAVTILQPPSDAQTVVISAEISKSDGFVLHISDCPHSVGNGHGIENGQYNPDGTAQIQVVGGKIEVYRSRYGYPNEDQGANRKLLSADVGLDTYTLEIELGKAYAKILVNKKQIYEACNCGLVKWMGNMYMGINRIIKEINSVGYKSDETAESGDTGSGVCDVCVEWMSNGQKCAADNCAGGVAAVPIKVLPLPVISYDDTCWSPEYGFTNEGTAVDDSSIYSSREAVTKLYVASDQTGIRGLKLTYGDVEGKLHGKDTQTTELIELADGECITRVSGEFIRGVPTAVLFESNLDVTYGPYGLKSGLPEDQVEAFEFKKDLPGGERGSLIAFKGEVTDGSLVGLQFGFECNMEQEELLHPTAPTDENELTDTCWTPEYGSEGTSSFEDTAAAKRNPATAFRVVYDEGGVAGLQFTYGDGPGTYQGPDAGDKYTDDSVELEDEECIIKVEGQVGSDGSITNLKFSTNKQNVHGPYAESSGEGGEFSYEVDVGDGMFGSMINFGGDTKDDSTLANMKFGFECCLEE